MQLSQAPKSMWRQRSARALARALQAGFALSAERPPASTWDPRAPWLRCCAGFALGGAPTCTPAEQSRAWMPHACASRADSPASVQLCQQRSLSALSRHRLKAAQQRARELAQGQSFDKLPAYLCLCVLFLRTVAYRKVLYCKGAGTKPLGSDLTCMRCWCSKGAAGRCQARGGCRACGYSQRPWQCSMLCSLHPAATFSQHAACSTICVSCATLQKHATNLDSPLTATRQGHRPPGLRADQQVHRAGPGRQHGGADGGGHGRPGHSRGAPAHEAAPLVHRHRVQP